MSTTEIAVLISAIAVIISAVAAIFSAITARATIKYAKITEEMAKNEKRKHQYTVFNDRFDVIKNEYASISVEDSNGKPRYGFDCLKYAFKNIRNVSDAFTITHTLNHLVAFRLNVTDFSILIDELNSLDEENKRKLVPFVLSFYNELLKPTIDLFCEAADTYNNIAEKIKPFKQLKDKFESSFQLNQ